MTKNIIKKFNRDFQPSEKQTKCHIYIDNIEIPVNIKVDENINIKMSFNHKGVLYNSQEIINNTDNVYHLDSTSLVFEGITLNSSDIKNITFCINKIYEHYYD